MMTYKSIATFLHDDETAAATLDWAISAARAWGAHLSVICAGVNPTDPGFYYAGAHAVALQENLSTAREDCEALLALAKGRLEDNDVPYDLRGVSLMAGGLDRFLAGALRFCDLVILPKPYGDDRNHMNVTALEAVMFLAEAPVLVVPDVPATPINFDRIVVAWNETPEALRAAKAAIPVLEAAKQSDVVMIAPPEHDEDRPDPGGLLAAYLARHGASVEVSLLPKTTGDIAEILCRHATEVGGDMIVMGAYGHSRLREAVLGGATRHMLEKITLPVLMAR